MNIKKITINNNIQEQLVSFPVAKLLKEVGFECRCKMLLFSDTNETIEGDFTKHHDNVLIPTQQLAIDWIRVNFGIHIETIQELPTYCCYVKNKRYDKFKVQKVTENFNTPEEAKEEALLYTLKNLIK